MHELFSGYVDLLENSFDLFKPSISDIINNLKKIIRQAMSKFNLSVTVPKNATGKSNCDYIELTTEMELASNELYIWKLSQICDNYINKKAPSQLFESLQSKAISNASRNKLYDSIRAYIKELVKDLLEEIAEDLSAFVNFISKKFCNYIKKESLKGKVIICQLRLFKRRYISDILKSKYIRTTFVYESFPGIL